MLSILYLYLTKFPLCTGEQKKKIQRFHTVVDQKLLLSDAAFDGLFKAHNISLACDKVLSSCYTFIQTTVYNIDVGNTKESQQVKELRAWLPQEH